MPHCLVNIDSTIDYKMEAIEAHVSQNRQDHLVKWVEKVALNLGKQSGGRFKYAEGFMPNAPPICLTSMDRKRVKNRYDHYCYRFTPR